jgi:hypothetical protein
MTRRQTLTYSWVPEQSTNGDRVSGARLVTTPAYRSTALAWLAARGTWRLSDAIGWVIENLVTPGFLAPWCDEDAPFLWEQRNGVVLSGPPRESFMPPVVGESLDEADDAACRAAGEPIVRASEFPRVLEAAHARVRAELRGLFAQRRATRSSTRRSTRGASCAKADDGPCDSRAKRA